VGRILVRSVLPPVVFLALLVGAWQLAYVAHLKPPYALPSPADVAAKFWETVQDGRAGEAIWTSLSRGAIGFGMSLVIGTLLGLAMWWSRWLRAAIGPIVSGLQSLPSVAWVPAAIIWFSLSNAAIYTVVLLGAVPSIANGLLGGMKQVPPLFDRVGRVLGLSALGRTRYVLLPAALPGYLGGLRQGWAFAWRSLMAAELITYSPALGQGLGQLLNIGRELSQMSLVITSITLILVVGMAIELLIFAPLERRVLSRRGLTIR
jgi:NitT/TauT family transport system permease protein